MKKGTIEHKKLRVKQSDNICQFIVKIVQMMKNYPNVVYWTNEGKSLKFKNLDKLQNEVIPDYFRHSNILSFIRQLNMYYFSKVESSEKDEMIFDHKIFKQGNEDNFHLIQRRNKFRDEILEKIQKNYCQTLKIIDEDPRLREQTKYMLRSAIEYHQIALKNLKKIKSYIDDLTEQLKSVRGKQVKKAIQNLQNTSIPALQNLITQGQAMEKVIRYQLCRDLGVINMNNLQSFPSQNYLLFGQPQTIKEMHGLDRALNIPSINSLIGFKSECSLGQNLREQSEQAEASIEQQIQNNNIQ